MNPWKTEEGGQDPGSKMARAVRMKTGANGHPLLSSCPNQGRDGTIIAASQEANHRVGGGGG